MAQTVLEPGLVGGIVKVETSTGATYEGELFCYDEGKASSLILRTTLSDGKTSYQWIRQQAISQIISVKPPTAETLEQLRVFDQQRAEERAAAAEENAKKNAAQSKEGISEEAQQIFAALNDALSCEWDGEDIVCAGVTVKPPFRPESCTGSDSAALARVQEVLTIELERQKKEPKVSNPEN
eukprot:TRINITY_DN102784_c0_g1_i1.p1 TRINITY_DN102784_c0_g1~~TRINITY_DN102784_c0_g1_i1.p1  ORF type:complete len:182 (+),score=49.72 TRINITY_DN102784_c0_g1_i1:76-621(+)